MFDLLLMLGGGLLAGTLGGLLGIGGGIVLMPLLRFFLGLPPAHAAGTCILAVFFTTLGGSYRHYKLGHVNLRSIAPIIISGVVATGIFSAIFPYVAKREHWLDAGIGIVFFLIAARMIAEGIPSFTKTKRESGNGNEVPGTLPQKLTIGASAGMVPGLFGIGTGAILVPAFTFISRATVKTAMAASLTCFCCNALISAAFKFGQGFMDLRLALPICLGTLIGANVGAIINRHSPSTILKLLFGLVFIYVSLKFFISFLGVMK